ncbi:methylmalonyl-CoA mutase family protein [Conexibacter sp. DBS9H8]|uniref:methylmalonyl-CoA mutase family protein n=1 Tax=Conexibacter sp. DBS9H8 TaxID=2937801 RepID=UPI00200D9B5C|nr:methylmalonyl-CoA mutase family protein [Conexibacter sp. DBS9H8]
MLTGTNDAPRIKRWLSDTAAAVVDSAAERWLDARHKRYGEATFESTNRSGVVVQPAYGPQDLAAKPVEELVMPGQFPYDRNLYPVHYQYQPWMDLQIIGYGVASQLRERMDLLKEEGGARGYFGGEAYNIIFDMPTSMGIDPDFPGVQGAIGDTGVSISKMSDFETLFDGKDLTATHVSMVCNAGSPGILALYLAAARNRGFDLTKLGGNITNYIWDFFGHCGGINFSPRGSYRLCADIAVYCAGVAPRFNTLTVSEHNICEAGANHVQAVAFSIATIIALNEECRSLGIDLDTVVPRYGFHVRYGEDFFEDIAKTRALRRMYAKVNRDRFACVKVGSLQARIHAQTAGSLLTVQQPLNNLMRNAYGAMSAVLSGVNGMTINAYDEALGIPTEEAVTLSLRTSQILAEETGVTKVTDPLGGSFYLERLTDEVERAAMAVIDEIDERGGLIECIESGWMTEQVARSAYRWRQEVESGARPMVGVNTHVVDEEPKVRVFQPDPEAARLALEDLARHRTERDNAATSAALEKLRRAGHAIQEGREIGSVTAALVDAAQIGATLGEMQTVLHEVFGRNK